MPTNDEDARPSKAKIVRWCVIGALLLLAVVASVVVPYMYRHAFGPALSGNQSDWNNFGTFVGGVLGPVLSAFAFIGLITTIWLQEEQLSLARRTLKDAAEDKELTRKQLEAAVETQRQTSDALALQNKLASDQAVKTMFFELVTLHNQIVRDLVKMVMVDQGFVSGIKLIQKPEFAQLDGKTVIQRWYEEFRKSYLGKSQAVVTSPKRPTAQVDRQYFDEFFRASLSNDGHYFRNLYRIFKFVHDSGLSDTDKDTLAGLIKAQLSDSELAMIFYNGKSSLGEDKFKPLIQRYKMFENMSRERIIDPESARDYSAEAFGDRLDYFFDQIGLPRPDSLKDTQ